MKNNLKYIIIILFTFWINPLYANDLTFDTETINIIDEGNLTIAKNGKANLKNENLEIVGETFEYYNKKKLLVVYNAISFLTKDNIRIKSNKI